MRLDDTDAVLQSEHREAAREEMDAQATDVLELQEPLATKNAELSHLSAKRDDLIDDPHRVESQRSSNATVSDDFKLVAVHVSDPQFVQK